jgi:phenylacetate-CoA ligase
MRQARVYRASPVWLQHVGATAFGWAWKRQRFGGRFHQYVQEFLARDHYGPDAWREYQTAALRRLLEHAIRTVPHYRATLGSAGLTPDACRTFQIEDLKSLPYAHKQLLRQAPMTLVSDTMEPRRLYTIKTSGTTGTPVSLYFDLKAHRAWFAANESRWLRPAGVTYRMRRATISGRRVVPNADAGPPFWRYSWAEPQLYFSAFHIAPENVPHYVRALNRYKPEFLIGYSSSHFFLARMIRELNLDVHSPRAILTTAETLTPEMRQTLESVYRSPVFDAYGSVEACCLAAECERHRLHASPDVAIVELLDQRGQPVPPGQEGEIVATGLLNFAQPLIRYRTGDWAVQSADPCPCGRSMPVLREVVGRIEDLVIGPDGREVVRFQGILLGIPQVREGQIIQETVTQFRVRIVVDDPFGEDERRLIQQRFEERLGPVAIEFEIVPQIERTANGKFRAVISHVTRARARVHA